MPAAKQRPNLLLIHMHDAGQYASPYGYAIPTPALQAFAEGGTVFRHAHCVAPTCSASRASLMTGQYAHQCGMHGLAHHGFRIDDYGKHVVHPLRTAGYHTALAGFQHVASPAAGVRPEDIGYSELLTLDADFLPPTEHAEAFLAQRSDYDPPFFLNVGYFSPHRISGGGFPCFGDLDADPRFVRPPVPLPDTAKTRADMARYVRAIRGTDAMIGRVLEALDRHGLADRTLVVITTDHGIAFPDMKANLTDHGTGVMLMMRGPGVPEGHVTDRLASHLDVFPTLFELAGLEAPDWWEGGSRTDALGGATSKVPISPGSNDDPAVFTEMTYHAAYEPMRSVRTDRFRYIRRFADNHPVLPANCDPGASRDHWIAAGWADRSQDPEALYDCIFDPHQRHNLIGNPRHSQDLEALRQRLDRWMEDTDDPLQHGPVAPAQLISVGV
ncbi:MAG: sulfatase [Planctomycetota bacterium]